MLRTVDDDSWDDDDIDNQQDDKHHTQTQPESLKTYNISKRLWYFCNIYKKIH